MKISITCPNCGQKIQLNIVKGKVESIELDSAILLSKNEISEVLKTNGIELG